MCFVSKSENANQVHYKLALDANCTPVGAAPLVGYWRNLAVGPRSVSPLLDHEQRAYGLATPQQLLLRPGGGVITVKLRALPKRPIEITVRRVDGACRATPRMLIHGAEAVLNRAHLELTAFWLDSLVWFGVREPGGERAQERLSP